MFARGVVIPEQSGLLVGQVEDPLTLGPQKNLMISPGNTGLAIQFLAERMLEWGELDTEDREHGAGHPLTRLEQRSQKMKGLQLRVGLRFSKGMRLLERFLGFHGEPIETHDDLLLEGEGRDEQNHMN
jgi:hypothetical protein